MLTSFLEYDESRLIEVYVICQMSTTIITLNCKDIMFLYIKMSLCIVVYLEFWKMNGDT